MRICSLAYGLGIGIAACGITLAMGCASGDAPSPEQTAKEDRGATLRMALSAPTFGARSVRIAGTRRIASDEKYACTSRVEGACFDFAIDTLGSSDVPGIKDLCPSIDLGASGADATATPWDFTLALFSDFGCNGTELTAGTTPSIACYAGSSVGVPGTENKLLGEMLIPGTNSTQIICLVPPPPPPP